MSNHPFVHVRLPVSDPIAAGRFYRQAFGWVVRQMPEVNYAAFDDGRLGGGFAPIGPDDPPGAVLLTVTTDDVEASLRAIEALGGKTLVPCKEIPGVGWWAVFEDPFGNRLGLQKRSPEWAQPP